MDIYTTVEGIRAAVARAESAGGTVGLVPTMGALHQGHLALIGQAAAENDFVVVSVFVNPTQFGPQEDLGSYPRDLDKDSRMAAEAGASAIFAPPVEEMYPLGTGTWVEHRGPLTGILCARSRPDHFRGVATVVTKLFNIVGPARAYFGQKDGQQVQVVRRIVRDLFMPLEIRVVPIVREDDGLARSSRNIYLSAEERRAALVLSQALAAAKALADKGERKKSALVKAMEERISAEPLAALEYVELYNFPDLSESGPELSGRIFIGVAARFGPARLIDNIVLEL